MRNEANSPILTKNDDLLGGTRVTFFPISQCRGLPWSCAVGIVFLLAVGASLLSGCGSEASTDTATTAAPVPTESVDEGVSSQTVRLGAQQASELAIRTMRVVHTESAYLLSLPGTVYPAPDNLALVSAPISGRVTRIYAHEGERVRKGQVMLELESLEYAGLIADFLQAHAEEDYQLKQVERLQLLVDKKISPSSSLEKAQADLLRAQASVQATHARLHALGITNEQLDVMVSQPIERPVLPIYAPLTGAIDEHLIDLGQAVTAYEQMMSIINLDQVLIRGYVSPEDAPIIQPGDPVYIGGQQAVGDRLEARIHTINPSLDEASRSIMVNILARTEEGWPLPGHTVRLQIQVRTPEPVLMVPLSAVEYEGEQALVFVRKDSLTYEKRVLTIGRITADQVIVAEGLEEGEDVAISQVFSLKALGRFEQYAEE